MSSDRLRALIWCAVSTKVQAEDDKASLPAQESEARQLAERERWRVVGVLKVPGHSRDYLDYNELAADARAKNIHAFDELRENWKAKGFDVLVVRDGDRFARTQALHAYVTESVIHAGARIYSLREGWVDRRNYRAWTALGGYQAARAVDDIKDKRTFGMAKRLERGLPAQGLPPLPYRLVRDERGRVERMELVDEWLPIWHAAASLLLEGVAWLSLGPELQRRFGYVNPRTGRKLNETILFRTFYHPNCWGATAQRYQHRQGVWCFDPDVPPPDGATIHWQPDPPIPVLFTGELGERVRAELRRRGGLLGRSGPRYTRMFSRLLRCGGCGLSMAFHRNSPPGWYGRIAEYYTCNSKRVHVHCPDGKAISVERAKRQISRFLLLWLRTGQADIAPFLSPHPDAGPSAEERAKALDVQIVALEHQVDVLIRRQALAAESVQDRYAEQIDALADQLHAVRGERAALQSLVESPDERKERAEAFTHLRALAANGSGPPGFTPDDVARIFQAHGLLGLSSDEQLMAVANVWDAEERGQTFEEILAAFWQRPELEINQTLHALLGKARFVVLKKRIVRLER